MENEETENIIENEINTTTETNVTNEVVTTSDSDFLSICTSTYTMLSVLTFFIICISMYRYLKSVFSRRKIDEK